MGTVKTVTIASVTVSGEVCTYMSVLRVNESIKLSHREAYFLFLKDAVFHVDGEDMSSSGNRAATNLQLKHRTATMNTKAASKKSIQSRKVRFQSVNVISTHKSEPCPLTSQVSQELAAAFERGVTF